MFLLTAAGEGTVLLGLLTWVRVFGSSCFGRQLRGVGTTLPPSGRRRWVELLPHRPGYLHRSEAGEGRGTDHLQPVGPVRRDGTGRGGGEERRSERSDKSRGEEDGRSSSDPDPWVLLSGMKVVGPALI